MPVGVRQSEEEFATVAAGVELCYQTYGDPEGDPLLLVMGLGGPMTWWDPDFCRLLAERGFFVVRFDNRDTGRSTKIDARVTRRMLVRAFSGRHVPEPYSLADLAADAFGLLDHLNVHAAHVAGISMGGMIAQTMAVQRPERVRSLTSIMSTTGRRTVGWQHPRLFPLLLARRGGREAYVATSSRAWQLIGSPAYPQGDESVVSRARETFDRGYSGPGVLRQMLAVINQPDRSTALRSLTIPALVIHGVEDKMVHVSGGRAVAAAIHGAELVLVNGMGHDLPSELYDDVASSIRRTADRSG